MNARISISRRIAALVVALIYVATSSTAIVHASSHAPLALERSCAASCSEEVVAPGVDSTPAADCFLCCHGPAVALASAPAALPAPSLALESVTVVRAIEARSAFRAPLPSLRAPPSGS